MTHKRPTHSTLDSRPLSRAPVKRAPRRSNRPYTAVTGDHARKTIIRRQKVEEITGLSRSEIYRREALGEFPQRVNLGARAVGWVADEVYQFIEQRISKSREGK